MAYRDFKGTVIHQGPTMRFTGIITVERSSEDNPNVKVTINGTLSHSGSYGSPYSNPKTGIGFSAGDSSIHGNYYDFTSKNIEQTIEDLEWTDGTLTIYEHCGFGSEGSTAVYCDKGWSKHSICSFDISECKYEPYKQPTISISGDLISRYDVERSISISANTSGDNNTTKVTVTVNNNTSGDIGISNNSGTYKFIPNNKDVSDGQSYKVYATRTHSKKAEFSTKSDELTLYTYRTPIIKNLNFNSDKISGFGNLEISWDTNGRRWNDSIGESAFETYARFGTSETWFKTTQQGPDPGSVNNDVSTYKQQLDESYITKYVPTNLRNQDVVNTQILMQRRNISSKVNADISKNISIQFTPKYAPLNMLYWDYSSSGTNNRGNSINQGSTLYLDEHPSLLVDWNLPDLSDRGVIDGFEFYVYTDSSYETKYKTFDVKTKKHSDLYGQVQLNIRSDLKRGQMNYAGVRAYYIRPNGTKAYGPELKQQFIFPLGKLFPPEICYPINNTTWHNKNFRILVRLSKDDDDDVLDLDSYIYKECELVINGTTYTHTENPNIFSVDRLGYMYQICINPSLISSHPDTNIYKIKMRMQKNYFKDVWSQYSQEITLNKAAITNLNLKQYEYILDTHYKYVRNGSVRLHNVYPIKALPTNNVDQNKGDIIYAKHYQGIYDTVLQIQTEVNNWARFDSNRNNVKFNQTINEMSGSNNPKQDFITAIKDDRPNREGRNYKNILIDCMNKLW